MHTFGRLLGFLRPYKRGVVWSLVLAALAMVCTVAIPWLTGRAVDEITAGDRDGLRMLRSAVVVRWRWGGSGCRSRGGSWPGKVSLASSTTCAT